MNYLQENIFKIITVAAMFVASYVAFNGRIVALEHIVLAQEKQDIGIIARLDRIESKLDQYIFNLK